MARGTRGGGRFGRIWIGAIWIIGCAGEGPIAPDGEQEWASVAPTDDSGSGSVYDPPSGGEPRDNEVPLVRQPPAEFEVLDPGREPRSAIRYQFRAGETSTLRMRVNLSLSMQFPNRTVRLGLPTQVDVQSTTLRVDGSGNARRLHRFLRASVFDLSASGVTVSAEMRKTAEDFTARIEHLAIEEIVDRRGVIVEASARLTEFADPMWEKSFGDLRDALGESLVPWPEQAIGVGARWLRRNQIVEDGVTYDQQVATTLTAREGSRLETEIEIMQRAPRQSFQLPSGIQADLQVSERTAQGVTRVQLDPFAIKSRAKAITRHVLLVGGERAALDATLSVELSTLGKQL